VSAVAKQVRKKQVRKPQLRKSPMPEFRPALMLENNQVPDEVAASKPGKKVSLQITGTIVSKREDVDHGKTVMIEVNSVAVKK